MSLTRHLLALALLAPPAFAADVVVHKRTRAADGPAWVVHEGAETWDAARTAVIVCDVWDAHHCLNAVRRVNELAPRLNRFIEEARRRGALVIHAPSSCMAAYASHPGRRLAQDAP